MSRPAMLVDIMWPLLSILEANQSAPMPEAITWELQLADSTDDATLREAYADRLADWGCARREADVRKEARVIRGGGRVPLRRHSPLVGIRYPGGTTNVGTEDNPIIRDSQGVAQELIDGLRDGAVIALPNDRDHTGNYEWDVIPQPGATVEVQRW